MNPQENQPCAAIAPTAQTPFPSRQGYFTTHPASLNHGRPGKLRKLKEERFDVGADGLTKPPGSLWASGGAKLQ
jgi:hypothetical protein